MHVRRSSALSKNLHMRVLCLSVENTHQLHMCVTSTTLVPLPVQVSAYTNGRSTVSEYDCLLLQNVLWQRPDEAQRIGDWLLAQLAADDGIKQMQYLLAGKRWHRLSAGRGVCMGEHEWLK